MSFRKKITTATWAALSTIKLATVFGFLFFSAPILKNVLIIRGIHPSSQQKGGAGFELRTVEF